MACCIAACLCPNCAADKERDNLLLRLLSEAHAAPIPNIHPAQAALSERLASLRQQPKPGAPLSRTATSAGEPVPQGAKPGQAQAPQGEQPRRNKRGSRTRHKPRRPTGEPGTAAA
jgi:hypothetical protein